MREMLTRVSRIPLPPNSSRISPAVGAHLLQNRIFAGIIRELIPYLQDIQGKVYENYAVFSNI